MTPVLESFPSEWETVIWDNSGKIFIDGKRLWGVTAGDVSVYGRYAAINYAKHDLIFTQDDDVIVSDPQAIVRAWEECGADWPDEAEEIRRGLLAANMPQEFRHEGYTDSCLVGFGAAFHRDLPGKAFGRFFAGFPARDMMAFNRCCDVVFTTLTPRLLVDVPKVDREFASDPNRMWKQPNHVGERARMLELVRRVRDA